MMDLKLCKASVSFHSNSFQGKMMAAMGLAGVGALAMKALGVSMAALMLAGIVGLKKLTEGGGDGGHQVHYVSAVLILLIVKLIGESIKSSEDSIRRHKFLSRNLNSSSKSTFINSRIFFFRLNT